MKIEREITLTATITLECLGNNAVYNAPAFPWSPERPFSVITVVQRCLQNVRPLHLDLGAQGRDLTCVQNWDWSLRHSHACIFHGFFLTLLWSFSLPAGHFHRHLLL